MSRGGWSVIAFAAGLGLASCAPPPALQPGADQILVVRQPPGDGQVLGRVSCRIGYNGRSRQANIAGCQNSLRNQAARLGADVVVVEREVLGTSECPNCITMEGAAVKSGRAASSSSGGGSSTLPGR